VASSSDNADFRYAFEPMTLSDNPGNTESIDLVETFYSRICYRYTSTSYIQQNACTTLGTGSTLHTVTALLNTDTTTQLVEAISQVTRSCLTHHCSILMVVHTTGTERISFLPLHTLSTTQIDSTPVTTKKSACGCTTPASPLPL